MSTLKLKDTSINPNVSVDCVIFGFDFERLNVLLIEREEGYHEENDVPKKGMLALPGDHIQENEDLDQAATRVLKELAGLENIFLEQFQAFGNPNRVKNEYDRKWMQFIRAEPDARVITIAYYSLVGLDQYKLAAASFARKAAWYPVAALPILAFDHNDIVAEALKSLRLKLKNEPVGFELLPEKFTLSQLQKLYEVILIGAKEMNEPDKGLLLHAERIIPVVTNKNIVDKNIETEFNEMNLLIARKNNHQTIK